MTPRALPQELVAIYFHEILLYQYAYFNYNIVYLDRIIIALTYE